LPATDAGLAEYAPQQLIIRFLPGASSQALLAEISGKVFKQLKTFEAVLVTLPLGTSLVDTIRRVQSASGVQYAEPNYIYRAFRIPNDPFFLMKQWGPQEINTPSAWDVTTGSSTSVVAIIDTGVSASHPDFGSKILTGTNCVTPAGSTDDDNGHGTHVAGIAAAIGDNSIGIAGISWLSSILPIKVLDASGAGSAFDIACGLNFAARFAAATPGDQVVANMSLGGLAYSQMLKDAVDLAISDNVVVIAAAGNDGKATVRFPAGYPGVMAVGATDPTNARAVFSSYGSQLSVVAPGVDIYSTLPGATYGYKTGTSMAAPHVSGVAALVRAKNPTFTAAQVRSQIERTAISLPAGSTGLNPQFGWGLVNAAAAVGAAQTSNYGRVQVTVTMAVFSGATVDVIIWVGTPNCTNLSQVVQTAQTNSTSSPISVAVFSEVPAGSYCATASSYPAVKGSTSSPFTVTAGGTVTVSVNIM
jgi:thermitase